MKKTILAFIAIMYGIGLNAIRVSAQEVGNPTNVRLGYSNWLVTNLYNNAGLPASPFRTDNN